MTSNVNVIQLNVPGTYIACYTTLRFALVNRSKGTLQKGYLGLPTTTPVPRPLKYALTYMFEDKMSLMYYETPLPHMV